jgi:hypothetical protein
MKKNTRKKLGLNKDTIRRLALDTMQAVVGGKFQLSHEGTCPPGDSNLASLCANCASEGDNC